MNTKEKVIQELEKLSEPMLGKVLEFVKSLEPEPEQSLEAQVWQAYLDSEREREEVYRRLAKS